MREDAVQVLFMGLRENIPEITDSLALLRDCPDMPRSDRDEIRRRLSKAVGLARTGDWMWYR